MLTFKNYKSNTDGNVAMMFAVTSVMLLTGIAAAIDFTTMSREKNILQAQVDAGVLAAALVSVESDQDASQERIVRMEAANEVISANGYDLTEGTPTLTLTDTTVILSAATSYTPSFGSFLGLNDFRLSATAESGLPGADGVDIALVLDNTRSMNFDGKLDALKLGASNLVDAIEESDSGSKIGLVPFARYVRLNESLRNEIWLDVPQEYDTPRTRNRTIRTGGNCHREPRTRVEDGVRVEFTRNICTGQNEEVVVEDSIVNSRWEGCVGSRVPPFSETDGAYAHKIPGLLTTYPEEVTGVHFDRNTHCPSEIVPVTDDYADLRTEINGMWTTDETYLPMGLIWGQRVLSPDAPFANVAAGNEPENRKVMILMTDGLNTTEIEQTASAEQSLDAPPFIAAVDDDDIATEANASTKRVCENAKAAGTEIYTIAFQVTDPNTISMLNICASAPENALTATSNIGLVQKFEQIAEALEADIRLIR